MKRFAIIGAAGYIAPRHMRAISETGNSLVAAMDTSDSVGIIDRYFPEAAFFTEMERFDRHLEKLKSHDLGIDYLVVCTPNHLHDAHMRFGLKHDADVICEKPMVLNPWNITNLVHLESDRKKSVYNILQLRLHENTARLREDVQASPTGHIHQVELTYLVSRGNWYYTSWKGDAEKSGGISTNIGIHLFDLLAWVFGELKSCEVHQHTHDRASGFLSFEKAEVRWFLSINKDLAARVASDERSGSFRSLKMDGQLYDFSTGFEDLHTQSYHQILNGKGFGIADGRAAIELAQQIRVTQPTMNKAKAHPFVSFPLSAHPFQA